MMRGLKVLGSAGLIWGIGLVLPEVNDVLNSPLALALALVLGVIEASYLATQWVFRLIGYSPIRCAPRIIPSTPGTLPFRASTMRE